MTQSKPDPGELRHRALDLLARREHSRAELATKLRRRGFAGEAIAPLLDELEQDGLLSEARFAESFVRSRVDRGFGPLKLAAELAARGLDRADAEHAIASLDVDWVALAAAARRRRFGDATPSDFRERARQSRFLAQRGFDSEQIRSALGDE